MTPEAVKRKMWSALQPIAQNFLFLVRLFSLRGNPRLDTLDNAQLLRVIFGLARRLFLRRSLRFGIISND